MAEGKKSKANAEAARPQNVSVGETLRAARIAKGFEIEDISSTIHIRAVQLRAIEENNLEGLPGMTYAVGFVRSYANFLGLNGTEIVHKFKAEHGQAPAASALSFPEPVAESRMPDPLMVGVGAFLAVVVLVLWTVYSNMRDGDEMAAEQIPPAPVVTTTAGLPEEDITPLTEIPVIGAAAPDSATPGVVSVPDAEPPSVTALETPAGEQTPPAEAAQPKAGETVSEGVKAEDDPVINIRRGESRIVLKANQATWIQVSDARENVIYRKVLRPGEQYSVPDQKGLSLVTANAGGLEIYVDGQKVQTIGKPGEIVRGVVLDPAQLKKKRIRVRN